ncbi:hypothetical protein NPIL_219371 [Nephila pilipes]|uniref:Uncharacterized protein n=1 Tax=Nephila pilipes TaxID=299642 RepID=A0A8X6NUT9_NEPPI|nr:hypothetical protein NPIL_219371 [Nephila pilipes]
MDFYFAGKRKRIEGDVPGRWEERKEIGKGDVPGTVEVIAVKRMIEKFQVIALRPAKRLSYEVNDLYDLLLDTFRTYYHQRL